MIYFNQLEGDDIFIDNNNGARRSEKLNRFSQALRKAPFYFIITMPKGLQGFQKGHKSFLSKEVYEKIAIKMRGNTHAKNKRFSDDIKKRMSLEMKRRWQTLEYRNKVLPYLKKIGFNKQRIFKRKPDYNLIDDYICPTCNKKFSKYVSHAKRNKINYCSPKCHFNGDYSYNSKDKSSFWRGGITPLLKKIRNLPRYNRWVKQIFSHNNHTCQECYVKGHELHAHHKKFFSIIFGEFLQRYSQFSPTKDIETLVELAITYEPFWDTNNGVALCKKCHLKGGRHER